MIRISCLRGDPGGTISNSVVITSVRKTHKYWGGASQWGHHQEGDSLCQLVSESPVAAVVRHHELLQLVQILSPLVCVQQL